MKVFIPLTDDMIDAMDGEEMPVPYRVGVIPLGSLEILSEAPACEPLAAARQSMSSSSTSPGSTPSSSALPALSSRTYRAGPALG